MCWNNVEVMLTLGSLDKLQNIRTLVRNSSKSEGRAFFHIIRIVLHILVVAQGPELQCLLKVKQDLSLVLIFQHAILNAK